ncbi:hypothetical protein PG984_005537 [Apiospora sp. TS-2023a]
MDGTTSQPVSQAVRQPPPAPPPATVTITTTTTPEGDPWATWWQNTYNITGAIDQSVQIGAAFLLGVGFVWSKWQTLRRPFVWCRKWWCGEPAEPAEKEEKKSAEEEKSDDTPPKNPTIEQQLQQLDTKVENQQKQIEDLQNQVNAWKDTGARPAE